MKNHNEKFYEKKKKLKNVQLGISPGVRGLDTPT